MFEKKYDVIDFIRPGVANFGDIVKTATMFVRTLFKDSKKGNGIRNYVLKCNLYIYIHWYSKRCRFPVKTCWCQRNSRGVSNDLYTFGKV